MSYSSEDALPGWYGKLPGMGDFAHRRLQVMLGPVNMARAQRWLKQAAQAAVDGLEQDLDAVRFDALLLEVFGRAAAAPAEELEGTGVEMLVLPEYGQSLWFTDPQAEVGQGMSTHGLPQDEQFDALFGFWAGATSGEEAP